MKTDTEIGKRKRMSQMNKLSLEKLTQIGIAPNSKCLITNVFHVYNNDDITKLQEELIKNCFIVNQLASFQEHEGTSYWLCEADKELKVAADDLDELTDLCVNIASIVGVEYDGWYTEVKRDE